ncbi:MAG TPA: cellulase family glycosylhydrolase, partial [Verrucomicrobiae bacterium]|nr:cellulase family glycosylhydrolase [Verrucomicrobiae bacterium]
MNVKTTIQKTILSLITASITVSLSAQTLTDIGTTAPAPGVNDIYQLSTQGNTINPDGLNYFTDNQISWGSGEPGQTFTTGANSAGYTLTSVAFRTGGIGTSSGTTTGQPYYLHVYSISGSTATLLQTYTSGNVAFNDGDWLKWTGLSVPLVANTTYAYSFGKASSTSGWEPMAVCSANALSGGEIALISPSSGAVTTGGSHAYDAVFDVGLVLATTPSVGAITISPWTNVPAGVPMTFSALASGASPLSYQWQFNNGGGFVNLSGANTNPLTFTAAVTNTGSYRLVLANSYGSVTSAPVALAVSPGFTNIPPSIPFPQLTYGMNIGNKLELSWGAPNPGVLYNAAYNGFNAVRVPCAWNHNSTTNISGGVTNYPINASYMAQVKQTVDAAVAAGMYVMINDHWDDGWLESSISTNIDPTINAKMKDYWTQIATTFAGYDNHLLFAAANEPNVYNTDEMKVLVYYYQTFVNAVRGAGGNNTNRWLVLQSVSDPTWMNALPTDTVSNRLMVEYHNYTPSLFSIIHSDQSWGTAIYFWGPAYHYSGDPTRNATWGEEYAQDSFYQQLADLYVSKGIPVMIGEFGASGAGLTGTEATWNQDSVLYWDKYLAESARVHGLSPFYWSTGGSPFDYDTAANDNPALVTALTGGTVPPPPNGAPYAASGFTATGGSSQVTLSWTAGSGATSYNLYRAAESGYEGTNPVVTGITGTSYTDINLNSGTTYYYLVAAANSSGLAGFSPEAHATTSGVNPDPAQYSFETDPQDWTGGGGIISGVATSTTQHFAGRQSLAVNFNGSSSGSSTVYLNGVDITPGATITFHVWIPGGSQITSIQPYMQDYNWNTTWGNSSSLTANAWNTFTLTVPQTATAPLQYLVIEFWTRAAWTGTCYIDSISWNNSGPDFNLSASPSSLTVNGGSSGTSTITAAPFGGLNGVYTLSASNLPGGVTATFSPNPTTGSSIATLTASSNVTSGTTNVTITATSGLLSHTTTIALTLTANTLPAAPTALGAAGGSGVVNLHWTQSASPDVTGNNVYRSTTGSGGPYNLLANLAVTTSYSDTAVTGGKTYFYSVSAVNSSGESALSAYAGAMTIPSAPTGLSATAGNAQVALSWTASTGASSYNVKRATVNGGPYTTIATGVASPTYTDSSLANGTTYYYVVSAVNSSGESANSDQVSATPSAPTLPAAPTSLTASSPRKKQIALNWTQSTSPNITNNKIYRATTSGGPYTLV